MDHKSYAALLERSVVLPQRLADEVAPKKTLATALMILLARSRAGDGRALRGVRRAGKWAESRYSTSTFATAAGTSVSGGRKTEAGNRTRVRYARSAPRLLYRQVQQLVYALHGCSRHSLKEHWC